MSVYSISVAYCINKDAKISFGLYFSKVCITPKNNDFGKMPGKYVCLL